MRGRSRPPSGPLPSVDVLEAGRVDARRLLRPPPLAAAHHHCLLTPPRAAATAARERATPPAASRRDPSAPRPWPAYRAAIAWLSRRRWWARAAANPNQITTPIGHRFSPDQTITVLDPRHHLCGQTLPLVAITHHSQLGRCCVVWLQPHGERLVPVRATNLEFEPNDLSPSPLSLAAVEQLLRVFQDIQHAHQGVSRNARPSRPSRTPTQARRPDCAPSAVEPAVSRPATARPTGAHRRCTTIADLPAEPTST
jgi:hypothetical protein